jgi:hypothetical protein
MGVISRHIEVSKYVLKEWKEAEIIHTRWIPRGIVDLMMDMI